VSEVKREHREAAVRLLEGALYPLDAVQGVKSIAQALADIEAATEARAVAPWEALAKYASETTSNIQPSWHGEKHGWTIDMICEPTQHGGGYGPTIDAAARSLCEHLGLSLSPPPPEAKEMTDGE
jgi:hypothetical protein